MHNDRSVLEMEIKTNPPSLFHTLLALVGPHLSHEGRRNHCREDKQRVQEMHISQIRSNHS